MKKKKTITGVEGLFEPGADWSGNYTKEEWKEIFREAREANPNKFGKEGAIAREIMSKFGIKPKKDNNGTGGMMQGTNIDLNDKFYGF